ncbi:MAG: rhodanese-like domain-containing protein [Bacteroidia bacterium]|nr:rhodanese-like domain-containing protein [Bacteroidia bacterium]
MKKLLGIGPKVDYAQLVAQGAKIIDVRTPTEYKSGHIQGSINIPLQELSKKAEKLSRDTPIITCCASGIRSASAKRILQSMGFKQVYNGGAWHSLENKIEG